MEYKYNVSDYKILMAIMDEHDRRIGRCGAFGTTRADIASKVNLSLKKISDTLSMFIEDGLVKPGPKQARANTYLITDKGLAELVKVKTLTGEELINDINERVNSTNK